MGDSHPPRDLAGTRVTVLGLGRFGGGIGVARWLCDRGAIVTVTDQDTADNLAGSLAQLEGLPIEFRLGGHDDRDFSDAHLVVTSPAVRPSHPMLAVARAAGVPITLEIRLFLEHCPPGVTFVGVTGTKGKSTTTALLGRMLERRRRAHVGGNLGGSMLAKLPETGEGDVVVLELSSFMLEHLAPMRWSPRVAVVTMVSQDHLDWHGDVERYHGAKRNLVRFQRPGDDAVLCEENEVSASFAADTPARPTLYGIEGRAPLLLRIAGRHNQLNAQAALAAAGRLGVSREEAQLGIAGFAGLPHRMQVVHESGGVTWVNDSIATIPEAAVAANKSFPAGRVIQIVGGSDKKLDCGPMCRELAGACKAVLTIGEIGRRLASQLRSAGPSGKVWECGDLNNAVAAAKAIAEPGDVVLLSTGTASYDQFNNFEERGAAFEELAKRE